MLYIVLSFVFGFSFLIPIGIAVFRGNGSRRLWDSILVGLFNAPASVGLVIGFIAVPVIFAPEFLASGVGWLAVLGVAIAIPVALIRVTRGWLWQ